MHDAARVVSVGALVVITTSSAFAQQSMIDETPNIHGQWEGPYVLPIGTHLLSTTEEIVHAALLPPPAGSDDVRVLLGVFPGDFEIDGVPLSGPCGYTDACNPGAAEFPPFEQGKYGSTYIWKPARPTNAQLIPSPYGQLCVTDADQDFFCGGHTFLPDGDLLWIGGTNPLFGCPTPLVFTGHRETWRLDVALDRHHSVRTTSSTRPRTPGSPRRTSGRPGRTGSSTRSAATSFSHSSSSTTHDCISSPQVR